MNLSDFQLHQADSRDAQAIANLVNLTYRGPAGWTRETAIIDGTRTCQDEIEKIMLNPEACFLVSYWQQKLAACICVVHENEHAYIGFFAVDPELQKKGLGKQVLMQAEMFASSTMGVCKFIMFVVSQRQELIAFYRRRGYVPTGRIEPYPLHLGMGIPKVPGLTIEYLEKLI